MGKRDWRQCPDAMAGALVAAAAVLVCLAQIGGAL
jgi:hypothetical protein